LRDDPKNPHYKKGDNPYNEVLHKNSMAWPAVHAYLAEMASVLGEPKYRAAAPFMVTEGYPQTNDKISEYLAYYKGMDPAVSAPFNFEGLGLPWQAAAWHDFLRKFHSALDDFSPLCIPSYAFGNHDQQRLVSRLGEPAARSAAVLLLTLPGMAFVYNGDEIGMKNGAIPPSMVQDPGAKGGDGRDPERTPMQWTPGSNAGFTQAKFPWLPVADNYQSHNVETESSDPNSFLTLYRQLTKLRNQSDAIRYGSIEIFETGNKHILGYVRQQGEETYVILVNFSASSQHLGRAAAESLGNCVLSSQPDVLEPSAESATLAANEAVIYQAN
jgi:alpha-glucosidase